MEPRVVRRHLRKFKGHLHAHPSVIFAARVDIDISDDVTIGAGVIISEDVRILTHDHFEAGERKMVYSPLVIGRDAFIGTRATILESCSSIGEGAVIGACAVVTHDVPSREVWAGSPAKKVGMCNP